MERVWGKESGCSETRGRGGLAHSPTCPLLPGGREGPPQLLGRSVASAGPRFPGFSLGWRGEGTGRVAFVGREEETL